MRDDGFAQSSAHKQIHAKRVNAYGVSLKFNLAVSTSQSAFFSNARVVGDRHVAGAPRDDGILFLKFLYITLAHQFLLSPMDHDELRRAIEEPARMIGLSFEEGSIEAIVRDVVHEPGALPFMEHALLQLWEKRRKDHIISLRDYYDIGGVQGALAKKADEVFNTLSFEQQDIARRILLRLTQPG